MVVVPASNLGSAESLLSEHLGSRRIVNALFFLGVPIARSRAGAD